MPNTEDVPRKKCPNCGQTYHEPVDNPASPGYLWECHVLFECPNPDQMEKARLNASGREINEVWP